MYFHCPNKITSKWIGSPFDTRDEGSMDILKEANTKYFILNTESIYMLMADLCDALFKKAARL